MKVVSSLLLYNKTLMWHLLKKFDVNPNLPALLSSLKVVASLLLHDKTLAWDLLKKFDVKSNIHDISFQNKWETLSHCRLVHYYVNNQ